MSQIFPSFAFQLFSLYISALHLIFSLAFSSEICPLNFASQLCPRSSLYISTFPFSFALALLFASHMSYLCISALHLIFSQTFAFVSHLFPLNFVSQLCPIFSLCISTFPLLVHIHIKYPNMFLLSFVSLTH